MSFATLAPIHVVTSTLRPLRIRPACDVEPGVLDEHELDRLYAQAASGADDARHPAQYVQSCLAVDFRSTEQDAHFGPQATLTSVLPEPRAWVGAITTAILESLAGRRAPTQFARCMTTEIYGVITRRHAVAQRRGAVAHHRSFVRKVAVCEPADGVIEASVVVHHEGRVRAIALRVSGVDGRWLITAFEMG
ncbi:MAG: Rv3235 family protein [Actinomycetota bacterium]|nr:Rv3235 family protein [Actinomycetota bacterium]